MNRAVPRARTRKPPIILEVEPLVDPMEYMGNEEYQAERALLNLQQEENQPLEPPVQRIINPQPVRVMNRLYRPMTRTLKPLPNSTEPIVPSGT